jgi:hypothetical protein
MTPDSQEQSSGLMECPFDGCDWEREYDPDDYYDELMSDSYAQRHYEDEHAGRVRVRIVLEAEQLLGDRTAQEVSDAFHESWEEKDLPADLMYTYAEVVEEADEHPSGGSA